MTIPKALRIRILCLSFLLLLVVLLYGNIFFLPGHLVYSRPDSDFALGYFDLYFTLSQIKQGLFPLWCPQMMGGYPYFAGLQTAIFYPFAILYLFLSINVAANLFFLLHIFLIGAGTLLWLLNRKMNPIAALLSAAIIMFSSFVTMRLNMGQNTPLAVLTWFPWLLLTIDNLFQGKNLLRDTLLMMLFVCLQITGGFPQQMIYSFVAVIFYTLFFAITDKSQSRKFKAAICLIVLGAYLSAALINAIQLLTTLDAIHETARKTMLPHHYRSEFSLSPSSLITLLSPYFFGNGSTKPYWGPWHNFYSVNFLGITSLMLAFYGAISSRDKLRWIAYIIIVPFFVYTLGNHTPFFDWVSKLPLFATMRVPFRTMFYVDFFVAVIAGLGLHELFKSPSPKKLNWTILFNLLLIIIAISIYSLVNYYSLPEHIKIWQQWTVHVGKPINTRYLQNHPMFAFTTAADAKSDLLFALTILCSSAIFIALCRYYNKARYLLFTLTLFELILFASTMKRGFPIGITYDKPLVHFLQNHRGDKRFLKIDANNWAMSLPYQLSGGDINGYESFRLSRYEDFVDFCQGYNIGSIQPFLVSTFYNPIYRILRCSYVFHVKIDKVGDRHYHIFQKSGALPHLLLLDQWQIVSGTKKVLQTMSSAKFNLEKKAVLETAPKFFPSKSVSNSHSHVILLDSSSQWLDIKATTNKNCILLVTDVYAKGWKVLPYPDSSQKQYEVMPADYIVRGIPLSPGFHHFRLEYAPDAFYRGRNISIAALIAYLLAWCALLGITIAKKKSGIIPFEKDGDGLERV